MYLIFLGWSMIAKMIIESRSINGFQNRKIYVVPRVKLHAVEVGCESVQKFWNYGPKCNFVRMAHMKQKRKWIILIMLQCWAIVKRNTSLNASLNAVLISSAIWSQTWWQTHTRTDTQTDTQTDRQTEWLSEKHNTFFQRYNKFNFTARYIVTTHIKMVQEQC